jgi:hypothetical protein
MSARTTYPVIIAAFVWGVFVVWTLYRLGSHRAQMGVTAYTYGVKRIGIGLWLVSIFLEVPAWLTVSKHTLHGSLWLHALLVAFVTLPVCLWVGYVWGQTVHALAPPGSRRRRKRPTPP